MAIARVALDLPLHRLFDYLVEDGEPLEPGLRLRVPFGRGEKIGILVALPDNSELPPEQLKPALEVLRDTPPLPPEFFRLCEFASNYYQAPLGEVMLQALPPGLKKPRAAKRRQLKPKAGKPAAVPALPDLNPEQAQAVAAVCASQGYAPFLLHGVTGSGKTEVYLRLIAAALEQERQALLLVPEINLTPQLEARIRNRFPGAAVAMLHSELAEAAREREWKAAFLGEARIVVGTRLAVFTPLPELGLIVIDEEHDPSYKQQDGMRYSARDLAIYRASSGRLPIVLGSATPSLESWAHAQNGRYTLLRLQERAVTAARLPAIRLVDTRRMNLDGGLSPQLLEAIRKRLEAGEQSLIFLNRRGYAPVLSCTACGWVSRCSRCAANMVVHLKDQRLRCHHCGFEVRIPRACPTCGNQDIHPFGRGTQRLEAWLAETFPQARILRVDRDSAKSRKQWEALLEQIHGGAADILVGTQMLAKGHDFPRLTLVGAVGADAALFAADWRAPERLFAQLMQVAGRAGRADLPGEVIIQTEYPDQPLYGALQAHDYPRYAATLLEQRRQAGFPPYTFQAMLRAEAPHMADAIAFLQAASGLLPPEHYPDVLLYDPVPMRLSRLWSLERAQLLVESPARPQLQAFLSAWRPGLESIKGPSRLRWHLEVDPLEF
ncbi:primosomal protein N' [Azovibrio restrictus]|uniref:primosomal protein N' n=1 Tax=Azovibrio restrictus TaxID=146938 RepID=UPI0026F2CC1E|nr:primosomal protein N' [Azovibrio restrictus]MDD3482547.1 primosomal protein N' [Azovibrio restrictus]